MATYGKVHSFDPQNDDWPTYVERLGHYFMANKVTAEAQKRSILLTVCGTSTYKLLRSLVKPGALDTTSYDDLVKLVKAHYNPKPSAIVQRFHFNSRSRGRDETVANFVAALRELALHCDYRDYLHDMLRDRLVHGINHKGKLLSEPSDLTFDRAFSLAQALEATERDSKALSETPSQSLQVHKTQSDKPYAGKAQPQSGSLPPNEARKSTVSCYRCGGPHLATQCRHLNTVCRCCRKRGHLARVCNSRGKPQDNRRVPSNNNYVMREEQENSNVAPSSDRSEDTSEAYDLFTLSAAGKGSEPYSVNLLLNGVEIEMELDTGAALSVINEVTYNRLKDLPTCNPLRLAKQSLKSYSGHEIQLLGVMDATVRYDTKEKCLPVHVVAGEEPNLLAFPP